MPDRPPPEDEAPADEPIGSARDDERRVRDDDPKLRGRLEQFIPDIVRRTFYAGLGAVFTTEEGIRKVASEVHLPKDVANYLIQTAAQSKDQIFEISARELRAFLESANLSQEIQKVLTSLSFEIKTEIRFIPNDEAVGGIKPDIKRKVGIKRSKDEENKEDEQNKKDK